MKLQDTIEHLETFGYCLIKDVMPAFQADAMAEKYFRLHQDPANREIFQDPNAKLYQTLFGVINLDEMCWECIAHPEVLQVVRHFLCDRARFGEACTKWVKPHASQGAMTLTQHTICQHVCLKHLG